VNSILLSLLLALIVNGAFFAVAAARKTDAVTDLSYSLTFALLAVALLFTDASRCRSSPRYSSSSGRYAWGPTCSGGSCE
jgi:steroid 5-alpha reductase family enzyme